MLVEDGVEEYISPPPSQVRISCFTFHIHLWCFSRLPRTQHRTFIVKLPTRDMTCTVVCRVDGLWIVVIVFLVGRSLPKPFFSPLWQYQGQRAALSAFISQGSLCFPGSIALTASFPARGLHHSYPPHPSRFCFLSLPLTLLLFFHSSPHLSCLCFVISVSSFMRKRTFVTSSS
jgi:hypothetical protein